MDFGWILEPKFQTKMEVKWIKTSIEKSMDFWIAPGTAQGCQKAPKRRDQHRADLLKKTM